MKAMTRANTRATGDRRVRLRGRRLTHSTSNTVRAWAKRAPTAKCVESRAVWVILVHAFSQLEHAVMVRMTMCAVEGIPTIQVKKQSLRQVIFFLNGGKHRGSTTGWACGLDRRLPRVRDQLDRSRLPRAEDRARR